MNLVLLIMLLALGIGVMVLLIMAIPSSGQATSRQINQTVAKGLRSGDEASDAVRNDVDKMTRR